MIEVIEETLIDSIKILPFLLITYIIMEYIEHKMKDKSKKAIKKSGKYGPIIGSILGIFPQCGFSVSATNLYAGRVITLGTLIAIYLSTSDEMLPIFISEAVPVTTIVKILLTKLIIGIIAGFAIDITIRQFRKRKANKINKKAQQMNINKDIKINDSESIKEINQNKDINENENIKEINQNKDKNRKQINQNNKKDIKEIQIINQEDEEINIEHLCEEGHCHCEHDGIIKSAIKHTINIFLFIIIITFIINTLVYFIGEEAISSLLLNTVFLGPIVAGLIGLIPNCAASVILTNMYLENVISAASLISGLLVGAGVGLAVLFKTNKNLKENIRIVIILYLIGVISGFIIQGLGIQF